MLQDGMPDSSIRSNLIKSQKTAEPLDSEMEVMTDVEDTTEPPENHDTYAKKQKSKRDQMTVQFTKQKSRSSSQLLPTEVCCSHHCNFFSD